MKITLSGKEYHVIKSPFGNCTALQKSGKRSSLNCSFFHAPCDEDTDHRKSCEGGNTFLNDEDFTKYITLKLTT